MAHAPNHGLDTGKDGKPTPRVGPPSALFGLDTLNALLAEQIDPAQPEPAIAAPTTIEAWLAREGLEAFAAEAPDPPPAAPPAAVAPPPPVPETRRLLAGPSPNRDETRRRLLLGMVDRLTGSRGAAHASRSA